jgi:probable F420-dependent oxidoreductase
MADLAQFGLDVGIYGPLAQPETVLTLAQFAEQAGFGSVWLADHVAFPTRFAARYPFSATGDFPAPTDDPLLEPIATMGVLAGATSRIRLGTAVLIIPYRNPIVTARQLITVDQFSGGRVVLGAGVGWLKEEFEALHTADFALRGKATDEYLEIFKAMASGGEVAFDGETYRFNSVHSVPGSVQRPHPPILIGGISNPALRRVVRHGGWLATALEPRQVPERLATLQRLCGEAGRRYEDLELAYKLFVAPGDPREGKFGGREPGSGSQAQIVDDLKAVLDAGFATVILRYRGDSAAEQTEQMERFAADVLPKL